MIREFRSWTARSSIRLTIRRSEIIEQEVTAKFDSSSNARTAKDAQSRIQILDNAIRDNSIQQASSQRRPESETTINVGQAKPTQQHVASKPGNQPASKRETPPPARYPDQRPSGSGGPTIGKLRPANAAIKRLGLANQRRAVEVHGLGKVWFNKSTTHRTKDKSGTIKKLIQLRIMNASNSGDSGYGEMPEYQSNDILNLGNQPLP